MDAKQPEFYVEPKNVNYISNYIGDYITKKALNFFSAFLLPNLDLNQGPSD